MANIDKVNPATMVEDETKRSEQSKKFVTEWVDNKRTAVIRKYNGKAHELVEVEDINNVEYEDVEVTEHLNRF